jgi:diadenosine tetraphosphatase ApaH/serine/threonine PP2A family protein phosphatase
MYAWCRGHLAARGHLEWLSSLPLELRLTLPDGTRLLANHAAPGNDGSKGKSLLPTRSEEDMRELIAGCAADLVCAGHTHWPLERVIEGVRILNAGSVSNPWAPDVRACWTLLEADAQGCRLEQRRVPYDVAAVLDALARCGLPTADELAQHFRGERTPAWLKDQVAAGRGQPP